jgi:hypothetical protein
MPFVAYSIEKDAVNVVPLHEEKVFRHKLNFDNKAEEIVKLIFTSKFNLFIVTCGPSDPQIKWFSQG